MTKRLVAKTGEYQRDGQTKGEYVQVGILMVGNDGGEYMLMNPEFNPAGALIKQNALAIKNQKQPRDMLMVSVFEINQQQAPQGGYQPQAQGYQQGNPHQQPSHQASHQPSHQVTQQGGQPMVKDDIPF